MQEQINILKQLRLEQVKATDQLNKAQKLMEQSEEWQLVEQCKVYLEGVKDDIKEADDTIRVQAIEQFHDTGEKNSIDGVKIVLNKICEYQLDDAIEWCNKHALYMFKLNTKEFEKHAKAVNDTMPIEFVEIKEEPSVRISKEL